MRGQVEDPGRRCRGSTERTGKGSRGGEVEDPMREQVEDSMRRQAEDLVKDRKRIPRMTGRSSREGQ